MTIFLKYKSWGKTTWSSSRKLRHFRPNKEQDWKAFQKSYRSIIILQKLYNCQTTAWSLTDISLNVSQIDNFKNKNYRLMRWHTAFCSVKIIIFKSPWPQSSKKMSKTFKEEKFLPQIRSLWIWQACYGCPFWEWRETPYRGCQCQVQ